MSYSILSSRRSKGTGEVPTFSGSNAADLFGARTTSVYESATLSSMDSFGTGGGGVKPPGLDDYPWQDTDFLRNSLWPGDRFDRNDLGWNITYVGDTKVGGESVRPMQRELNGSATAHERRRGRRQLLRVNAAELHNAMYIQHERVTRGLGRIAWSGDLIVQAQEWAQYMASMNRIEHRYDLSSGVDEGWSIISENVAMNHEIGRDGAHLGLMNSEGHRANILDPRITRIGIGIRQSGVYFFMCQIFKAQWDEAQWDATEDD